MAPHNNRRSGGSLRKRRKAAGITQVELAYLAQCSPPMVQLLERGYVPRRSQILPRIEDILGGTERDVEPSESSQSSAGGTNGGNEKRPATEPGASTTSADGAAADARPA